MRDAHLAIVNEAFADAITRCAGWILLSFIICVFCLAAVFQIADRHDRDGR